MRLSRIVRSAAMGCAVWLGAAGALAQVGYAPSGGESAIAGDLPGDQATPALSLSPSGGFLVWRDNATCPFGLGVSALALDNSLHGVGSPFRVNKLSLGDQESPQVTLLNGGGAAFVWQGGRQSFQHIYGRFLSTNNAWDGAELLISSATNCFQRSPALTTLSSGNVVVTWSSLNQAGAGTMQDVYALRLSPAGQKLGGEFLVNQFTTFNQRSPAVAALSGGGFVVAWVSELQRSGSPDNPDSKHLYSSTNSVRATVDIYARLFDANGVALGNEFLVNTSDNICSHPSVSAAADGGFLVTWAERDVQSVQVQGQGNGWDVYARVFSSDGTGGAANRVNTYVIGDQYAPHTSSLGTNYLVLWTSVGQDGSGDGVYGQFLQADGTPVGDELRINTTTFGRQMQPTVAADGAGRFLAVWSSYTTNSHSLDLVAQTYASPGFVPAAATVAYAAPLAETYVDVPPAPGTGMLPPSTLVGLQLPVPLAALTTPLSNSLAALPGSYSGLFYDTNGVSVVSAGSFSAKVTPRYTYSAKLLLGGRTYSVSGQFDRNGQDSKTLKRSGGLSSLQVQLQLVHLSEADQIRGTVADGANWQAQIVADRLVFNNRSYKALAYAGNYTLVVPPVTGGPEGSGYGTLKIDTAGMVHWTASLADGSKLTQSSTLSAQGYWPLYGALYRGKGLITSWVQITTNASGGRLIWIKPPGAAAPLFSGSFTNSVDAAVSAYSKSTAVGMFQNGILSFSGGSMQQALSKALMLNAQGKSVSPSASQLNVILSPATGLFRGTTTLLSPSGRKVTFQGVLLENGLYGAGYFQNGDVSGQVYWSQP